MSDLRKLKPRLSEFFVRGVPLAQALDMLERWDTVTDAELVEIGFTSSTQGRGLSPATPRSSSLH
jgi:hypothetical protein